MALHHRHSSEITGFMPCRQVRCRHVVVTCPLAVLQRGDVAFRPPLPAPKLAALDRVKMSNAIKVGQASSQWCDAIVSGSGFAGEGQGVSAVNMSRGCLRQHQPHAQACHCFRNVGCCGPEHQKGDRQRSPWRAVQPSTAPAAPCMQQPKLDPTLLQRSSQSGA